LYAELSGQEVQEHVQTIIQDWWNIEPAEWACLCAVAWYSLYFFPRCYLDFGISNRNAAAVVAAACPGVEIYGVDSWQGTNNDLAPSPDYVTGSLHKLNYRGYLRLLTGNHHTAFQRLKDSTIGSFLFDLALVRGDMFEAEAVIQQINILVPHLTPGGLLIFTCTSVDSFQCNWSRIQKKFTQFTYIEYRNANTGLILTASLQNEGFNLSSSENKFYVDLVKPVRTGGLARQFSKACHALKHPSKYPKYAKKICPFLIGQK